MERRLAAILAADVVGYSKLMGEDEAGTLMALRQFRRAILALALDNHNGNLTKSMGDGWLVEFASAADAVACALHLQTELTDHETIKLRIGVHIGDVTFEDEDIYGDGVNIASRLQEMAPPRRGFDLARRPTSIGRRRRSEFRRCRPPPPEKHSKGHDRTCLSGRV
ncbi:MAG: adenylate/guanylate cyclase domain-containing protein [Alphaproteobacteria bacterium]